MHRPFFPQPLAVTSGDDSSNAASRWEPNVRDPPKCRAGEHRLQVLAFIPRHPRADEPIQVMSLLPSPTGNLTNLSP